MDLGLEGKVALVTGASKGIGLGIAQALANEGARVALASRSQDRIDAAARSISGARGFVHDTSDLAAAPELVRSVREVLGPIEILVVSTGGPPAFADPLEPTLDDFRSAYESLMLGSVAIVQAALPGMTSRGWGRVVSVSSFVTREPARNLVLSSSHRAALLATLKTYAHEVAEDGVTINSVLPGRIAPTDSSRTSAASKPPTRWPAATPPPRVSARSRSSPPQRPSSAPRRRPTSPAPPSSSTEDSAGRCDLSTNRHHVPGAARPGRVRPSSTKGVSLISRPHYVIVGAGTAGPVIAARLSEDPAVEVVLLEAGKENTYEASRTQGAFFALFGSEADWGYETTGQPGIGGRAIAHPRGKAVGGSTVLNVGAWLRGALGDYDVWAQEGATGWDGAEALRTYLRIEDTDRGPSEWRGSGGPITLSDQNSPTSLADSLLFAFTEAGYGPRGDVAGATPYVADRYQTIFKARTRRTPADSYLTDEVRARPNLRVLTEALVTRIVFEGTQASGVVYEQNGTEHTLEVEREVILAAGVINTPQLLMLSGVGPAAHLREHGIDVIADVPGVGENLHDHPTAPVVALAPQGVGGSYQGDPTSDEAFAQWRLDRSGPAAFFSQNGVGFVAQTTGAAVPDYELLFDYNPDISADSPVAGPTAESGDVDQRSGYKIWAVLLHPKSRGTLRLASTNPHDKPVIDPAYLSHPDDLPRLVEAMRHAQNVTQTPSLAPYTEKLYPAVGAPDSEFHEAILNSMYTTYHLVGTARIGNPSDEATVVDPQLRVRGVTGLRVADASVIPSLISGHTIAPSVMIGERAAELIRSEG